MNGAVVSHLRAKRAKILRPRPLLLRPRPLYCVLVVQTRIQATSHESPQASVLALLVAQAIRWRYSQAWSRRCVVAFEMVWGGCNPSTPPPPPPRSAHAWVHSTMHLMHPFKV